MEDKATPQDSENILALIGAELRSARRERGLKLVDIAERLRILPEHITAIEQGNPDLLPSMAYVIGYVRSYANLVGADANTLCRKLRDSLSENEIKPNYDFVQNKIRPNSNAGLVAAAAVGACFLLYAGWYVTTVSPTIPDAEIQTAGVTLESTAAAPSDMDIAELEQEGTGGDALQPLISPAQPSVTPAIGANSENNIDQASKTDVTERPAEKAVAEIAPVESGDEKLLPAETAETKIDNTAPLTTTATQAMAVNRVPGQEMTIHAVATSWVEITRADGSRVSAWLMQKDENYTIPVGDDLYLTTGNAGGLEIVLGQDETFLLGEWGETIQELPLDKSLIKTRP